MNWLQVVASDVRILSVGHHGNPQSNNQIILFFDKTYWQLSYSLMTLAVQASIYKVGFQDGPLVSIVEI